jgi:DNA-binding Lrp family transcriptional regulator
MRYTADTLTDTPRDISRLTVPEAARALGISPEAVRNRLSRGTLDSVKENGTVYVLLEADKARSTAGTPNDTPRPTADISGDAPDAHAAATAALVAAKDETISLLRSQLEAEREANRENRRIIAGLVQRVPELEAPRGGRETATAGPEGEEHHPATDGARSAAERRSWIYRFLFRPQA